MKTLLMPFYGHPKEEAHLENAFELVKTFEARLTVLHMSPEVEYLGFADAYAAPAAYDKIIKTLADENLKRCISTENTVKQALKNSPLPLVPINDFKHKAAVHWVHETGHIPTILTRQCLLSDLVILNKNFENFDNYHEGSISSILFDAQCPLLLMPSNSKKLNTTNMHIMIAWNNSNEARNALMSALPFLVKAEKVSVLIQYDKKESAKFETDPLSTYLKHYGVQAEIIKAKDNNLKVREAILKHALSTEADMLVMGAYGHSRFRQMILGGVTHHILKNANLPVLMMH